MVSISSPVIFVDGKAIESRLKIREMRQCRHYYNLFAMKENGTELSVCEICGVKAARVVKRPQVLGRGARMMSVDNAYGCKMQKLRRKLYDKRNNAQSCSR